MSAELTTERADGLGPAELAVDGASLPPSTERGRLGRALPAQLQVGAPAWIWLGIAIAIVGFALILVAWGQVAGESQVYLQLPYVVSAGLVGLGLVMVGLMVLNISSRHRDAIERDRQITQLVAVMEELQHTLADHEE